MGWGLGRGLLRLAVAAGCAGPALSLGAGGVGTSTTTSDFAVEGSTALGLVRYMNSHAVRGDHGAAYARIHPNYELSLATQQRGDLCVPTSVRVDVDFDLTVPVAVSPDAMSARTLAAWNGFAGFARAHEAHHKASYIACATAFVAKAQRQTASECFALESTIRGMLAQMKRDCETKQIPFDRSQARVLPNLRLFTLARSQRFG